MPQLLESTAESRGAPPPPQDPSPLRGTLGSSLRSPAEGEGNEGFPPPPDKDLVTDVSVWGSIVHLHAERPVYGALAQFSVKEVLWFPVSSLGLHLPCLK